MPSFYSPTYYEDRKSEHDFYINLGNECKKAEEHRQALRKAQMELQEQERLSLELQEYNKKLDKAKSELERHRKLSHALMEYNYNKDMELVLFTDRITWRDCLSPEEEACYREWQAKVGIENRK